MTGSDAASSGPRVDVDFNVEPQGYAARVALVGEHDLDSCEPVRAALGPIWGNVLVDLSECTFIDSSMIRVVLAKSQELAREGYRLELIVPAANEPVARVVDMVGLRAIVTVHDRRPARDGIASCPSGAPPADE